jgi:tRNA threonylcarbamoyladenosine biosynthesis protein TsaB
MLLAIDTSTAFASVALYALAPATSHGERESDSLAPSPASPLAHIATERGALIAEHSWRSGRNHTVELLPRIEELLAESGVVVADLTAIGVALGPGSFNGLRVGLATAKMLAFSRSLPLVGVTTLEYTAYQHAEHGGLIRPIYDAGRGQIATALYRANAGVLAEVEPAGLANLDVLTAPLLEPVTFCGEIMEIWRPLIESLGELAVLVGPAGALRRAGYLAELCARRLAAGEIDDVNTLQPLYLRRPPVLDRAELPGVG